MSNNKKNNKSNELSLEDIVNLGDNIIKIHFEKSIVFKKQIELIKKIVSNDDFQITFLENSFNICYKNVINSLTSFINFNNFEENEYEYNYNDEKYIITLEIDTLIKSLKYINNSMDLYIKKNYKDNLIIEYVDKYGERQLNEIKLLFNKNNSISSINLDKHIRLKVSSEQFSDYCKQLLDFDKQIIINFKNNQLTLSTSTSNIKSHKTISNNNIKILQADENNISSKYNLDEINSINTGLCNANTIFLSYFINNNLNVLIIEYILTDGDKKYGQTKFILSQLNNN